MRHLTSVCITFSFIITANIQAETHRSGPSVDFNHGPLKVSQNNRYLIHADGTPFFYLGDTAWELFHRLNREEAQRYLENRRAKGFTVIQAFVLAELDGLNVLNSYGHKPLIENDPARPNEAYFKHVDFIVETARKKGIYIGMLPTWGDKVTKAWGKGPVVFNEKNAYTFGRFLANRYKSKPNIIWILGGDRVADNKEAIWRSMAESIKDSGDKHLLTYHPQGDHSSTEWFHKDDWLDFNMLQSGHGSFDKPNYQQVQRDYHLKPVKPCFDGEPRYENHPVNWKPANGWFNDFDVRQAAYWNFFAGGFGHTYGCHDIWQMKSPKWDPISSARNSWYEVMDLPGAWDMLHVRNLMESRQMLSRVPDQNIIASGQQKGGRYISATRGNGYLFVYTPYGDQFEVQMDLISSKNVKAQWFDPRTGKKTLIGEFASQGKQKFDPPGKSSRGNDWVLILDDIKRNFTDGRKPIEQIIETLTGGYLKGVGPENPMIYDNDWWTDTPDKNYLWIKASRSQANVVGNIVTRDMWNWQNGYLYKLDQGMQDARKSIAIARRSGVTGITDPVAGCDKAFDQPQSGKIEDTRIIPSPGSTLIVQQALKATPQKPLLIFVGGPLNTVANAYLMNPAIADRTIVFMTDLRGYNGKDKWANYIVCKRCKVVNYGAHIWWPQRPELPMMPLDRFKDLPDNDQTRDLYRIAKWFWDRSTKAKPDRDDGLADGAPIFLVFKPQTWLKVQPQKVTGIFNVQDVSSGDFDLLDARACDYHVMREAFFAALIN